MVRLHNGKMDTFDTREGLSEDQVTSIVEDAEGNLWVGTQGGGLNRFRDGAITSFSAEEGFSQNSIFCVYEDRNGILWTGSTQGLDRYENGKLSSFTKKDGLPNSEVLSLWGDHQGALWVGTSAGLSRFQNGRFTNFTTKEGLSGDIVLAVFEDSSNALWIGTLSGISRYHEGKFQSVYTSKKRQPISAIVESADGSIWAAIAGKGIVQFQNGKIPTEHGLPSNVVISLHADREGMLWIGTYEGGLIRYGNGKFTQYTTAHGLHQDSIYRILEDDRQNLWMSSNEGIFRVSKKELNDFADSRTATIHSVIYGKSDGMRNVECNGGQQPAGWKSHDGKLWFPTAKGLVRIDPNHLPLNCQAPPVHLEQLVVDDDKTILLTNDLKSFSLPPGDGRLEFHFTALSFTNPEKIRFQYMLEGLDRKWIDAANKRVAYYTNINPGSYTFRLKAANADGIWNETGAQLPLHLQPHFYQAYWFYTLCALAFFYTGFQIHRYRLRRALQMEQIRTRIATDLHDDIGAGLTQIAILSEVLQQRTAFDDGTSRNESLARIADSSRELIDSMSDIVWAVDPKKDKILDLVLRMRRFANDVLSGRNIAFTFESDGLQEQRELDPEMRKHIYLIYRESLNNLVRHSECKKTAISLRSEHNELILTVRDNGKGMDFSQSQDDRGGHGIRSMRQRAKEIGAKLDITSSSSEGTTILLRVPLR